MADLATAPEWALDLLTTARVAHLSTASSDGAPHGIPVCYGLAGDRVVIAIDEKPKSGRRLQRLRNIEQNPRATLVVDHYDEDWARLAWVLVRGAARIISPDDVEHRPAIDALREKYVQYREMRLEDAEVIEVVCQRVVFWRGGQAARGTGR